MAPLTNKKVIVIGGSSGIGFAVAKAVLAEGASVIICSSSTSKIDDALKRLGGGDNAAGEALDVTSETAVKAFFEKRGKFDHLVYTAGDSLKGGFPNIDINASKSAFDVRYWGALLCAQHSREYLSESFTVTSGIGGERPVAGWEIVAGGAGAVNSTTRNLAVDLAPVRVNCIIPGAVRTELWDSLPKAAFDGLMQQLATTVPLKRIGEPEEAAEAYIFVMKCTYMTGQSIIVDGGATLV